MASASSSSSAPLLSRARDPRLMGGACGIQYPRDSQNEQPTNQDTSLPPSVHNDSDDDENLETSIDLKQQDNGDWVQQLRGIGDQGIMDMFRDCVGGKYYWSNPTFVSQVVESGHEIIMTPFFNRHPLVCFSATSAEDARSQVIGVVIYLNGHKPIHIHLGHVCIFDNERQAYRPKDGFDYVSFAVPEISVVLNQQHSQQKSATDNDKSTNRLPAALPRSRSRVLAPCRGCADRR